MQVCRDPSGEGLFLEITHAETPAIGFSRFSDGVFTRALLSFESLSFSDVLPIKSIWSEIWITSSAYIKDPANVEESKAVIAAALNFVRQCAPLQLKTTMWMVRGHDER